MKNFKVFETESQYEAAKDNLLVPSISVVMETGNTYFKRYEAPQAGYTVDLNNQWVEDNTISYNGSTGGYKSNSNYNKSSSSSTMYIHIFGYTTFTLYVKSSGEVRYDYLVVSQLDKTASLTSSTSSTIKWTGYNVSTSTWYTITFNNIDGGEHVISLLYGKDSSVNSNDDRGFLIIPEQ